MNDNAVLLGIDIGATSVKVGAFSLDGRLLEVSSAPNGPKPQPDSPPEWRIWDLEEMWSSICRCSHKTMSKLPSSVEVKGIAVSGFGADGVPMTKDGQMLYPCISWHCSRTVPQSQKVSQILGTKRIYKTTGYHNYPINTLNRFLWLKENAPEALEKADYWLHVQDYIVYCLTGEFSTESTIASTMMCMNLAQRTWAEELLNEIGLSSDLLSPLFESGSKVGTVTQDASKASGIPAGSIVAAGGHDTELAILGSGVNRKETFLDVNGTWEILMAITDTCNPTDYEFDHGLDWECHAIPRWWNYQALMIAGGCIEWIRNQFYRDGSDYDVMIQEASDSPIGSNNVYLLPAFVRGMGPAQAHDPLGTFLGITTQTVRGDIARATFEALTYQFYQQIGAIEKSSGVKADSLRVAGGGQRNPFWMQMKADMCGWTLEVLKNVEATLLGAAILAGIGGGVYKNADEALENINIPVEHVDPKSENHHRYLERYAQVVSKIPENVEPVYKIIHSYSE